MRLPIARGALSTAVFGHLSIATPGDALAAPAAGDCPDDDAITLWALQELHYRGFEDVDERWEWDPDLLGIRQRLERDLEARLRDRRPRPVRTRALVDDLVALIEDDEGPSLARHFQQRGSKDEALHMLRQRSVYHLKEADPTSWVIPRLTGRPKAALLEVQFDEYGGGDPTRLHHRLFERGMEASGLQQSYGAYVDEALLPVLEQNTAISMFGLHRRLRGAALGHLAAFEATSSLPSRQLVQGLRRLGFPAEMVGYYDEHVEADAVHEQLAARDICGSLVAVEPDLADDVLFGAWACLDLEARTATALLEAWEAA